MSDLLKVLNNIRNLRVATRELTLEQLESIAEKISSVLEEKRAEIEAEQRKEQERQERIEKYKELLRQDGITADELAEIVGSSVVTQRKKREPRPAKYRYTDENGNQKTWTGQGRTPRAIQSALDAGRSLNEFEI
ncbi:H-NS family nucleoid-associated regulatory protein [Caviibacterium pharyngocola]|uniref:DNA-binding protein n=1 Tax=Caviibacterium pharyngocola TaxID=28159 RepID=A0A2M8RYL7_9PAST|nr:H-NS family nucleoid-associated regulatory protein [Caviibacterium pharyngocola]PJG83972.1 DNA-binding protein H-NS-like protein [Caviibacterium pharyngocola]